MNSQSSVHWKSYKSEMKAVKIRRSARSQHARPGNRRPSTRFARDDPEPGRGSRRGVEDLEAALEQFREIATDLGGKQD